MRKAKLSIWMTLLICIFFIGCSPETDTDKEITPIKILVYNEAKECIGEMLMDDYGNLIKQHLESGDVTEDSTIEYEYDKSGNILRKHYQSENDTYTEEHVYDKSGNAIKTTHHRETSSFTHSYVDECEYDQYGNVTLRKHTQNGQEPTITEYIYTYEGEQILTCETITDGKQISTTEYTYDTNGNVTKSYNSLSAAKVINIIETEYDEHNNATKKATTMIMDSTEQVMILEYENEYDDEARLIRTTQYVTENGERQFAADYEYIYE